MVSLPRVVIAATRSGDGKTTVATGVMAALRAAGLRVSPHKVGPDYIDPSYHAAACGVPGRNLDPWLVGEDLIAPLLLHAAARAGAARAGAARAGAARAGAARAGAARAGAAGTGGGAGVAVIEGVMGLFDGAAGRGDFASTAHVARLTGSPVILVVGAVGTSRSIAATVHGFATWDPSLRLAGVVLNQVSSDRHEALLREALAPLNIPVVGALRRDDALHMPSRHLGLVPAGERPASVDAWLPALRALVQRDLDLDLLMRIARSAPDLAAEPWSAELRPAELRSAELRSAELRSAELRSAELRPAELRSAELRSAELRSAEPESAVPPTAAARPGDTQPLTPSSRPADHPSVRDRCRGSDTRSVQSPGSGPPRGARPARVAVAAGPAFTFRYAEHDELLAAAGAEVVPFDPLAAGKLPDGTDALVAGGGFPQVHANALAANTSLLDDVRARATAGMPVVAECAGLLWLGESLDGRNQCGVLPARARMTPKLTLGYREATALHDTPLLAAGTRVRAHEFHRTVSEPAYGEHPAWQLADGTQTGWAAPGMLASYLHLHWAALPGAVARLLQTALARRTTP